MYQWVWLASSTYSLSIENPCCARLTRSSASTVDCLRSILNVCSGGVSSTVAASFGIGKPAGPGRKATTSAAEPEPVPEPAPRSNVAVGTVSRVVGPPPRWPQPGAGASAGGGGGG